MRLRELNPLHLAAAWLTENADDGVYTPEDILELAKEGKIKLLAMTPGWEARGIGEVPWIQHEKAALDTIDGKTSYIITPASGFISGDGRILVTPEMAARLLDHGRCSLECARMPIFDCQAGQEPQLTEVSLHGVHDGRMIDLSHVRVSEMELCRFLAARNTEGTTEPEATKPRGVTKHEILAAPWAMPKGYSFEQLERDLGDARRKWIASARVAKGAKGHLSSLWNPALLAMVLHDNKRFSLRNLRRVVNDHFPDYLEEWIRYEESEKLGDNA